MRRQGIAKPWPWRANLCACGERNANRRSLGGDGRKICSGYAASSSPLAFVSLTQGEGVGWGR